MKLKFYPLIAALLMFSAVLNSRADKVVLIELSGADVAPVEELAADISKIRFGADVLSLEFRNGNAASEYNYAQIKRIKFTDGKGAVEAVAEHNSLVVMPNPVRDQLMLRGGENLYGSTLRIYSVTGSQVMQEPEWCGGAIDVAHLAAGVYIINIQSVTLKFVKL